MLVTAFRPMAIAAVICVCAACDRAEPPQQATSTPVPAATAQPAAAIVAAVAPIPVAPPTPVAREVRPPECFDERTIEAVLNLIREKFLPGDAYRQIPTAVFAQRVRVDAPRPTRWDRDIAQYECVGTVVVDSSAGADRLGRAVLTNPQALHVAGSSVAEVERVILASLAPDRRSFTYPIRFDSQLAGDQHYVAVGRIDDMRAFLTGSFVSAHMPTTSGTGPAVEEPSAPK